MTRPVFQPALITYSRSSEIGHIHCGEDLEFEPDLWNDNLTVIVATSTATDKVRISDIGMAC